jgi:UDP-GlcNAc:undecaprenyl-phosphate GlcNAc-1-phosphate transferase
LPGSAPHHAQPTPLAGGLVIFTALLLIGWLEHILARPTIASLLLPAAIVLVFGLWDDLRGLSAPWKLAGQLLATLALIRLGVQVRLFDIAWLDLSLTVLWMIGITNAYNFVDSMDGLATGLASLAAAFFMLVTFDSNQTDLTLLSALLLGTCIGVFYFTAPPARFFLGDSGAQFLGFLLARLAIAYTGWLPAHQSWYIPSYWLACQSLIPLVVFSRPRRRQPIYQAGLDHTYHRLVALGMSSNRAVLTMQFAALTLGCLAFFGLSLSPLLANLIFAACLLAGVLGIAFLEYAYKAESSSAAGKAGPAGDC